MINATEDHRFGIIRVEVSGTGEGVAPKHFVLTESEAGALVTVLERARSEMRILTAVRLRAEKAAQDASDAVYRDAGLEPPR